MIITKRHDIKLSIIDSSFLVYYVSYYVMYACIMKTTTKANKVGLRLMCLKNPPIILSRTSQKIAYYSFVILIQYLLFLYYSFFLYCCRLLLETIRTSCQLKMEHIIIFIIIIIIICWNWFMKVHQNRLEKHSQNLAINNCG